MKIYILLIVLSIICTLVADRIDQATNSGGKLRRVLRVFCGGICLVSLIGLLASLYSITA